MPRSRRRAKHRSSAPKGAGPEGSKGVSAQGRAAEGAPRRRFTFAILSSGPAAPVPKPSASRPEALAMAYRFRDGIGLLLRSSVGQLRLPAIVRATGASRRGRSPWTLLTVDHAEARLHVAAVSEGAVRPGGLLLGAARTLPLAPPIEGMEAAPPEASTVPGEGSRSDARRRRAATPDAA